MSRKNNAALLALVAAAASGQTLGASIVEGLVNDKTVTEWTVYETDAASGRAMLVVKIGGTYRPVADSGGNVRIYGNVQAAVAVSKRNGGGDDVTVYTSEKTKAVGDPVKALIARHKSMKAEDAKAGTSKETIDGSVTAAAALGWDVAVGTPEAFEYADLLARQVAVGEWKTYTTATLGTLAASLTAAGINPATYLPV
jgi:hypothetical protein